MEDSVLISKDAWGALIPCFFCETPVNPYKMYCWGCKVVICEDCEADQKGPNGNHDPEDHKLRIIE